MVDNTEIKNVTEFPNFSKINIGSIESQIDAILLKNREQLKDLLEKNNENNVISQLEEMEDRIDKIWNPIAHLYTVKSEGELRKVYKTCLLKISEYLTEFGQNEKLYQLLLQLQKKPKTSSEKQFITHRLRDFRLSGASLGDTDKNKFKKLQKRLAELMSHFEENVMDATQAWFLEIKDIKQLAGMPEHALELFKGAAKQKGKSGYVLTLDFPIYISVMRYADDRELRESVYKAFVTRASDVDLNNRKFDNSPIMNEILDVRHQMSLLLGFKNYADLSIQTKMVKSTEQVIQFIDDLIKRCKPQAEKEYKELVEFSKQFGVMQIEPWDLEYFKEKYRKLNFGISQEDLRAYFPEDIVVSGMFEIANRIYGLTAKEISADTWHPDVKVYEFSDENGVLRGYIYFDLYARDKKRSGAWMDGLRSRRKLKENVFQTPLAFLTCNFTPPINDNPSLFTHDEVNTLFHEFGHCLHHILTTVDVMGVAGIRGVPWDAVELPSQFFENWCWEKEALQLISRHVKTKKYLPEALFEKLLKIKNFHSGMDMLRQLEFSLLDFKWHLEYEPGNQKHIQDTVNRVRKITQIVPIPNYNRFQHSFLHIFAGGYAAGYYSYKWAEVLSSDAFSLFEEKGIFDKKTGYSFMTNILEKGGSEDIMNLFIAFRGRQPSIDPLLRHSGIN